MNPTVVKDDAGPLGGLRKRLGAVLGERREGRRVVVSYGSVEAEYAALREGVAVAEFDGAEVLELVGEDRQRFLHGLTTFDVNGLDAGSGGYGFFTQGKGHILADAVVEAFADRLRVELPPGRGEFIAEHLGKYIIADRVEVRPAPPEPALRVAGPLAAGWLDDAFGGIELPPETWHHAEHEIDGAPASIGRRGDVGVEGFSVRGAAVPRLLERLADDARGAIAAGFDALEIVRVEEGLPRWGVDYGPESLPQETGLEHAVSYTKGCYLGQEVVARIHYRGQVNRVPRGLLLPDGVPPGAAVRHGGREAGRLGSVVDSLRRGRRVGLCLLHRRAAEPGTVLELDGGGEAEVVELPF